MSAREILEFNEEEFEEYLQFRKINYYIDSSTPLYYSQNGEAHVFLINNECIKNYKYRHYEIKESYLAYTYKSQKNVQDYNIMNLTVFINFQQFSISHIQEIAINQLIYTNTLQKIYLQLFIDELHEATSIQFIQSVLNLQTLKKLDIKVIEKRGFQGFNQIDYLKKVEKLDINTNMDSLDIFLESDTYEKRGFSITFSQGKINELDLKHDVQIDFDLQQLENVEFLTIDLFKHEQYSLKKMNQFLKKLINLKQFYVWLNFDVIEDKAELGVLWSEILQTISQLKQIQKISIKQKKSSKEKLHSDFLKIKFDNGMNLIQNQNFPSLKVTFTYIKNQFDLEFLTTLLSSQKNLKILKLNVTLKKDKEDGQYKYPISYRELKYQINRRINKQLKKLVLFNFHIWKYGI